MTKYTVASRQSARGPEKQTHPIWRGVGCLMMLFIPFASWGAALLTVQLAIARNWPVPYQLMGYPVMPAEMMRLPGLSAIGFFLQAQQNLYAILLLTVLYIVVIGAVVSLVYSFVWRYVGPPRYGPLDAPPPKIAVKRYKR
jgi:hypothetical protein